MTLDRSASARRRLARRDHSGLVREHHGLDAVAETELHQDPRDVRLHRRLGHEQLLGDLGIREAARDQSQHLLLAGGQILESRELRLGLRAAAAHELADHTLRHRRRQERVALRDHVDRSDELLGRRVLEEEPARAGAQRLVHVLVEVERRQHQDLRPAVAVDGGEDAPRRLEPVELGHADVHQHDVWAQGAGLVDRLAPVGRLADDLDLGLRVEDHAEAGADERLVVDEEDADHPPASTGSIARSEKPPSGRGPASSVPPYSATRSRIPTRRWPSAPFETPRPSSSIASSTAPSTYRTITSACAACACSSAFVSPSCTIRYAETSAPGESGTRCPSTRRLTGKPASSTSWMRRSR